MARAKNHTDDSYFGCVSVTGFSIRNKHKIAYPNLDSAIRPIPHNDSNLPIPEPPAEVLVSEQVEYEESPSHSTSDSEYLPEENTSGPKLFDWQKLNDLIRNLSLPKDKEELLASRLKEKNTLKSVSFCHFRERSNMLNFLRWSAQWFFCHNIRSLFQELQRRDEHKSSEWRLLINFSQRSLKAVLLHNGNSKRSVSIPHSVHLKKTYDNMKMLLEVICYNDYQ